MPEFPSLWVTLGEMKFTSFEGMFGQFEESHRYEYNILQLDRVFDQNDQRHEDNDEMLL